MRAHRPRFISQRGILLQEPEPALQFHPRCHLRLAGHSAAISWPAVIAGVTDLTGTITGVQRIFLASDGSGKAPIDDPKRALGLIHGHGVWFGPRLPDTIIVGEGLETMLALRMLLPSIPCVATLAASHLPLLLCRTPSLVSLSRPTAMSLALERRSNF